MTWTCYRVCFRLLSPMHIGWRKTSYLQQTRPYVTGRVLWGALTARLVRDKKGSEYYGMGKRVDEMLRFTYFYPTTNQDEVTIWPWEEPDAFSWNYLGSYGSTTLKDKNAEEGTLHEIEYISPKTRGGDQVYLMGYVIESDESGLDWRDALNRIRLGGEAGYGWGWVEPLGEPKEIDHCFDCEFLGTKVDPLIKLPKDASIFSHAQTNGLDLIGTVEPLVGRVTSKDKGFGGLISEADICWAPGSKLKVKTPFYLQEKGVWKACI